MKSQFAKTVQVISSQGRALHSIPAKEAERWCRQGTAKIHDARRGQVRGIQLCVTIGEPKKSAAAPTIQDYMGQRYTHHERMKDCPVQTAGRIEFNYIDPEDAPLFRLAVTDCLVGE